MSKMNKIITNNSVQLSESEVNNLIVTLGPVIEAFTGGGGGGSVIYTPGDDNISINNTQHTIALSTDAATKLNTPIPTKVSDLTDSASYATVDAINTKLDKDEFAAVSGDFATEQYVQAASAEVTGWVNNQNYLTQVPDTYYLKTETSGKDELSAAFDAILNYDVTAAAGIEITTATDNGTTTFGISMTAEPVVTDTNLSGYNGIAAAPDGTKSGWWNIGLTQDMLNTINGKLDSSDFTTYTGTTAPAAFQPKGDYATEQYVQGASADVTAWVNNQNYLKTVPSEYITETELSTALTNYVTSSTTAITGTDQFALTTTGWAKIQGGSTFTGVTTTGSISGGGVNNDTIGLLASAENALTAVDGKMTKPATAQDTNYVVWNKGPAQEWTSFVLAANSWANDFLLDADAPFVNGNNGLSASLVPGADNYVYAVGIDTANMTANKQYAFTTTGWEEVIVPSTSGYLPTSGGTVSGELIVSGGSTFDSQFLKITRENVNGYGRIGLGSSGPLALKVDDANSHTTQVNISPNNSNDQLVQVQHNGNPVGFLIPAVTATTTAGLTNDGILHIILESE